MLPANAGIMRGDCSVFQLQDSGIPEFSDCDVTLETSTLTVNYIRTKDTFSIPVNQLISADVTTYTVEDFKARTAFALTYQSDHPDGFDILTFRVKSKRAVTVMAALRQILDFEIHSDL